MGKEGEKIKSSGLKYEVAKLVESNPAELNGTPWFSRWSSRQLADWLIENHDDYKDATDQMKDHLRICSTEFLTHMCQKAYAENHCD